MELTESKFFDKHKKFSITLGIINKNVCFVMVFYNREANFTERDTYSL